MFECVEYVPEYAKVENEIKAIVARFVDGHYYFWGAFESVEDANVAAMDIQGTTFTK